MAALYFDNLLILDPDKASGGTIGPGDVAEEVAMLEQGDANVLQRVSPEEVLEAYKDEIAEAIRADIGDLVFMRLCETSGRSEMWTLALAKVPRQIWDDPQHQDFATRKPRDRAMQRLTGDLPRSVVDEGLGYFESYAEVTYWYREHGRVHDEHRHIRDQNIEYRYADFPLPLGESIMINHALFAGLLYSSTTPITDDPFHKAVLDLKMDRARDLPALRQVLADRSRARKLGAGVLASTALTDTWDVKLPVLSPRFAKEDVLEYRRDNADLLQETRDKLGRMARRTRAEPWTIDFAKKLESQTIPDIADELNKVRRAQDAWFKTKRGKLALKAAGVGVGATAAILNLIATPLMPIGSGNRCSGYRSRSGDSRSRLGARVARGEDGSLGEWISVPAYGMSDVGFRPPERGSNWRR